MEKRGIFVQRQIAVDLAQVRISGVGPIDEIWAKFLTAAQLCVLVRGAESFGGVVGRPRSVPSLLKHSCGAIGVDLNRGFGRVLDGLRQRDQLQKGSGRTCVVEGGGVHAHRSRDIELARAIFAPKGEVFGVPHFLGGLARREQRFGQYSVARQAVSDAADDSSGSLAGLREKVG